MCREAVICGHHRGMPRLPVLCVKGIVPREESMVIQEVTTAERKGTNRYGQRTPVYTTFFMRSGLER